MSEGNGVVLRAVAALPWSDRSGDPRERCADIASRADLAWQQDAACLDVGGELFFAEDSDNGNYREAKAVCARCPVAVPCLEYALRMERGSTSFGVWGGLSPRERANLKRRQRKTAA